MLEMVKREDEKEHKSEESEIFIPLERTALFYMFVSKTLSIEQKEIDFL